MAYLLEGHPLGVEVLRAQLDLEVLGGRVGLADVDGEPFLLPLATPACIVQEGFQAQQMHEQKGTVCEMICMANPNFLHDHDGQMASVWIPAAGPRSRQEQVKQLQAEQLWSCGGAVAMIG